MTTDNDATAASEVPTTSVCRRCGGEGCEKGCGRHGGCKKAHAGPDSHRICHSCHGSGAAADAMARGGAPSVPQPPERMVQVGWAGPEASELAGPLYDYELQPGDVVVDTEETERGTIRWTVNVGDWALRHEDGRNDLVDPWPVYGRRCDVPGEAAALDASGAEREPSADRPGSGLAEALGVDPDDGVALWDALSAEQDDHDPDLTARLAGAITSAARTSTTVSGPTDAAELALDFLVAEGWRPGRDDDDEATVEMVAKAIASVDHIGVLWDAGPEANRTRYRQYALFALDALAAAGVREALPTAAERAFLGRGVEVVLGEEEGVPVVAKGVLLGFDEGGGAVLRDEMGLVHWTWPRLDVRLAGEG